MDFSNGKIYRIRSAHSELPYIGSTVDSLEERFRKHNDKYKSWKRGNSNYNTSHEILKYDDAYIELVEKYSCNSRQELEAREGTYIEIGKNCVNKQRAGSNGDYSEYHSEWYQNCKERQSELQKAPHRKATRSKKEKCECGMMIAHVGLEKHKKMKIHQLFLKNPEEHAKEMKAKEERDKVPKYECGCGAKLNISQSKVAVIKKHEKRKKHQEWLKSQKK
jgi:hypothetical protein